MIRVRYYSRDGDDPLPMLVPETARAVPLAPYALEENECGTIVSQEIRGEDVKPLGNFAPGDEVLIESDDPRHAWFDETETERRNTHIWWRATVIGRQL